ncbi:unnamed protein product (macronuclear) [Paramecium tetraurelia]|uniref:Uncharacterized protein n=1 Tax=Paramecium tetraurelia TaxID=5888 RepID=A0DBW0_PARTE|nr:uncharacterized protein GSPATT00015404001 [Paramecium tetraurelia]CAK80527.1 unnamed protein product [Paramecium tetraurelia]|eukprot:XP_001447924.1 hypothetical protein (macronuclear) [Paramecium tetraurelia strain d4-2]
MNSKQLKIQIEVDNQNKENKVYQEQQGFHKQRMNRIPLIDITDALYPQKRQGNSQLLVWNQLKISPTIQLR